MNLFYDPSIKNNSKFHVLSEDESKHIFKVLRKKEGDVLFITNGLGFLFETQIQTISKNKVVVEIISVKEQIKNWKSVVTIGIVPTKNNDRTEWFLEKATEIGVDNFVPIFSSNSERKVIKKDRLEKVIVSAMKQCLSVFKPKLNEGIKFVEFLANVDAEQKFIAHCVEDPKKDHLFNQYECNKSVCVLIGPEGDFTPKEIELAKQNGFKPISLGDSRLRTETAGVVTAEILQLKNQI